jgi:hypothetical protein
MKYIDSIYYIYIYIHIYIYTELYLFCKIQLAKVLKMVIVMLCHKAHRSYFTNYKSI